MLLKKANQQQEPVQKETVPEPVLQSNALENASSLLEEAGNRRRRTGRTNTEDSSDMLSLLGLSDKKPDQPAKNGLEATSGHKTGDIQSPVSQNPVSSVNMKTVDPLVPKAVDSFASKPLDPLKADAQKSSESANFLDIFKASEKPSQVSRRAPSQSEDEEVPSFLLQASETRRRPLQVANPAEILRSSQDVQSPVRGSNQNLTSPVRALNPQATDLSQPLAQKEDKKPINILEILQSASKKTDAPVTRIPTNEKQRPLSIVKSESLSSLAVLSDSDSEKKLKTEPLKQAPTSLVQEKIKALEAQLEETQKSLERERSLLEQERKDRDREHKEMLDQRQKLELEANRLKDELERKESEARERLEQERKVHEQERDKLKQNLERELQDFKDSSEQRLKEQQEIFEKQIETLKSVNDGALKLDALSKSLETQTLQIEQLKIRMEDELQRKLTEQTNQLTKKEQTLLQLQEQYLQDVKQLEMEKSQCKSMQKQLELQQMELTKQKQLELEQLKMEQSEHKDKQNVFERERIQLLSQLQTEKARLAVEKEQLQADRKRWSDEHLQIRNELQTERAVLDARQRIIEQTDEESRENRARYEKQVLLELQALEKERRAHQASLAKYHNDLAVFHSEKMLVDALKSELDAKRNILEKEEQYIMTKLQEMQDKQTANKMVLEAQEIRNTIQASMEDYKQERDLIEAKRAEYVAARVEMSKSRQTYAWEEHTPQKPDPVETLVRQERVETAARETSLERALTPEPISRSNRHSFHVKQALFNNLRRQLVSYERLHPRIQ
ncbi:hypothetical protein EDD86DRAFT_248862 [Gorgonomyces haynaldii]|nr:hypothetical protein EDD86DRAFT_248862 [Gorgonomyces haynaldii]